jgi:hypothetical protein
MVAGMVGGAALMLGPVTIGAVRFDVNTMLYCSAAIILGSQLVLFWTFAEIFATGEGLLPPDPKLFAAFKYVTLEIGLAIGAGMFLAGLIGGVAAVASWGSRGFGDLDASRTLRLVIPSVTLMILGAQGIMSSFFLSVLGLRRR